MVRSLLLPAVLELLGRRTWSLPGWFDQRLPHLAIEPEADPGHGSGLSTARPAFEER